MSNQALDAAKQALGRAAEGKPFFIKYASPVGPRHCIYYGDGKSWPQDIGTGKGSSRIYCVALPDAQRDWPIAALAAIYDKQHDQGKATP